MARRSIAKDCPFSEEEIDSIEAILYQTNVACRASNPPHPTWMKGYTNNELNILHAQSTYKTREELLEEIDRLKNK